MTELEMVLNGIDEVEKCGLICEIDGTPCHHFPDSLITDIKNLLIKQNDIIEKCHRVNSALTLSALKNKAEIDPRIDPTKLTYDVNISKNGEIIETHRIVGSDKAHEFGEKRIKELGGDAGYGVWLR